MLKGLEAFRVVILKKLFTNAICTLTASNNTYKDDKLANKQYFQLYLARN